MKKIGSMIMIVIMMFCLLGCGSESKQEEKEQSEESVQITESVDDGSFMQIIEEIDNDDFAFKIRVSRLGNILEDTYGMSILIWDVYGIPEENTAVIDNVVVNGVPIDNEEVFFLISNEEKNMGTENGWITGPVFEWDPEETGGPVKEVSFHVSISSENQIYLDKEYVVKK